LKKKKKGKKERGGGENGDPPFGLEPKLGGPRQALGGLLGTPLLVGGANFNQKKRADGRSILKAMEFLAPYVDPKRAWPYQQDSPGQSRRSRRVIFASRAELPESKPIRDALKNFKAENLAGNPARLYLKAAAH